VVVKARQLPQICGLEPAMINKPPVFLFVTFFYYKNSHSTEINKAATKPGDGIRHDCTNIEFDKAP
jgi:hypothetical protein